MDFIVVNAYSPYTAIVARPWLHVIGVVSSTLHRKVKYPSGDQVEKLIRSQSMARQCLVVAIRHQSKGEPLTITKRELQQLRRKVLFSDVVADGAKREKLEKIIIDNDEGKFFQVGVQLPPWEKKELVVFLRKNVDVFTWSAYEAPGVDPNFIRHYLNVNPSITPVRTYVIQC